jgi:hypothetical protein
MQKAQEVTFAVTGFDPRDLLAGHFLRFRVDLGPSISCQSAKKEDACACLEIPSTEAPAQATHLTDCNRPSCDHFLRGRCNARGVFESKFQEYYFPDAYTGRLQSTPKNSSIRVALEPNGEGIVKAFYVDGIPLLDWLKTP